MTLFGIGKHILRGAFRVVPFGVYSRLVSFGAECPLPVALRPLVVGGFAHIVGADVAEAEKGTREYSSLGDFFARNLKRGSRVVDTSEGSVVSPCDGQILAVDTLSQSTQIYAKGGAFFCGGVGA